MRRVQACKVLSAASAVCGRGASGAYRAYQASSRHLLTFDARDDRARCEGRGLRAEGKRKTEELTE